FVITTNLLGDSAAITYSNYGGIYFIENGEGLGQCDPSNCDKTLTRYLVSHELMHILEGYNDDFVLKLYNAITISLINIAYPFYSNNYGIGGFNNIDSPYEIGVEMLNLWIWQDVVRDLSMLSEAYWGPSETISPTLGFRSDFSDYDEYIDQCLT